MKYDGICLTETRKWSQGHRYASLARVHMVSDDAKEVKGARLWLSLSGTFTKSTKRWSDLIPFFFPSNERSTLRRESSMSLNSVSDTHLNFSEETAWTFQNHLFFETALGYGIEGLPEHFIQRMINPICLQWEKWTFIYLSSTCFHVYYRDRKPEKASLEHMVFYKFSHALIMICNIST